MAIKKKEGVYFVKVYLPKEITDEIERLAKKHKIPESKLCRNLLMSGLDDAKLLDRLGALKLAGLVQKWKETEFPEFQEVINGA